jgi:hypothetical protein
VPGELKALPGHIEATQQDIKIERDTVINLRAHQFID